jgi:hypothetical protein
MTITALIISLFIQFGFISSEKDLNNVSESQQQNWYQEIIDVDEYGL